MDRYEFYDKINSYKKNDELKHYGTIGQKWGVRHWQNADGTFNAAGKERYFGSGKKNNNKEEEKKKWLDKAEEYTNRLQKAKTYKDIDKIENEILKDEHVKPYFDKAKEIYDKTGEWNKAEEYLMKTPIHEEDWIYDMMNSHITNWNQKIGGLFGKKGNDIGTGEHLREIHELKRQINEFEDAGLDTSSLEKMLKYYESKDDYRYGSQLGSKDETIKTTIGSLFSKKDNNLADKIREQAKELRKVGENDLADKYEARAKELDQYKKIGSQPGMSDEERKATKRACANCWKVAMRNKWPLFLLFGFIGGPIIGAIASNSKINKMIDQLGLDRQDKDKFTADDWDKITEAIKESRRKKPKNAE